jgi:ribosome-associated toxin RatA of RatAB toxin-antitoxin module
MALVQKSVLIPFSAEQMFVLVDNVADYPQFLPWCGGTSVVRINENTVHATVLIDYYHIKQSFTTVNVSRRPERIDILLKDGPFRQLDGSWHFIPLAETACKIEFQLHYEFSSKLLEKVFGPVFSYIANSFVDAFIHQAENIYGTST